jgi:hypothetical protein
MQNYYSICPIHKERWNETYDSGSAVATQQHTSTPAHHTACPSSPAPLYCQHTVCTSEISGCHQTTLSFTLITCHCEWGVINYLKDTLITKQVCVYGLRPWRYGIRIPAGTGNSPLLHSAHTSSEAHPASCTIVLGLLPGAGGGAKRPGRTFHLHLAPRLNALRHWRVKNEWSYTSVPHTPPGVDRHSFTFPSVNIYDTSYKR